ncbi:metallophosphoesterase [Corallococcus sp. AS-1-6]|uniref:metallophosphoesterase n=1 Tax=Corallococcus sp. AS-1-6 TaxID=2874599 RepID=UPI001CBA8995|nr:metallophosphoesterase [Corallococcus sp. AS-1-6]MBZ4374553.1 metallophosphoesterase [Corallococcus sp. AS-1-6]
MVSLLLGLGLPVALHVYIGLRLFTAPGWPAPWAAVGWGLLGLCFLVLLAGFRAASRRSEASGFTRVIQWGAYLWLGAFGVFLTAVLASDVVGAALSLSGAVTDMHALARGRAAAVLGTAVPAVAFAFVTARGRARVERTTVALKDLGPGLEGLRVVQLSDVHVGPTLDGVWLQRVVDQVNALAPDLVAITGDLVDGSVDALRDQMTPLASLKAPLGVYYVTGNHEFYHGARAWMAEVSRLGITVLTNEHRVVERGGARLVVAGVTDHDAGHMDPPLASRPDLALAGAPPDVPRLLLAHQPRTALSLQGLRVDLQLSGHTHGGQIFPFMFFVKLQQPVVQGLATVAGTRVYTHRGTGYWGPPLRLGPAPEIASLTLVGAPRSDGDSSQA